MATIDHTPRGRGYEQSLIYFHHANDYWQYTAGPSSGTVLKRVDIRAFAISNLKHPKLTVL